MGAYALAAALLLALLPTLELRVEGARRKHNLATGAPTAAASPLQVLGTMVGGFRGLAIDFLWMRAMRLQNEERKYYESALLFEMILRMESRFPEVWGHLAWNLAYNISIEYAEPRDRWTWVRRGIRKLEEGIEYNPETYFLYRELGTTLFHKMTRKGHDRHHAWFQRAFLDERRTSGALEEFERRIREERGGSLPSSNDEYMFEFALAEFRKALKCRDAPEHIIRRYVAQALSAIPARWREAEREWEDFYINGPIPGDKSVRDALLSFLKSEMYWADRNAREAEERGDHGWATRQREELQRVHALYRKHAPDDRRSPEEIVAEWRRRGAAKRKGGAERRPGE